MPARESVARSGAVTLRAMRASPLAAARMAWTRSSGPALGGSFDFDGESECFELDDQPALLTDRGRPGG